MIVIISYVGTGRDLSLRCFKADFVERCRRTTPLSTIIYTPSHNAIKLVELSMQREQFVGRVACFSQPTLLGINVGLTIEPLAQPTAKSVAEFTKLRFF